MTHIDRFVKSIYPAKRRIVSYHSSQVPWLTVHEAGCVAENNKSDSGKRVLRGLEVLVKLSGFGPKYNSVFREVAHWTISETPVLVYVQAAVLIKRVRFENVEK